MRGHRSHDAVRSLNAAASSCARDAFSFLDTPFMEVISIELTDMAKNVFICVGSVIREGERKFGKSTRFIVQGDFGINTMSQMGAVRIIFSRQKDELCFGDIAGVDIDRAFACARGFSLKLNTPQFEGDEP